jgi:hypothetical protein
MNWLGRRERNSFVVVRHVLSLCVVGVYSITSKLPIKEKKLGVSTGTRTGRGVFAVTLP